MEISGIVKCVLTGVGSKSEGVKAFIETESGQRYTLYREGVFPLDDAWFRDFDGKKVSVTGEAEEGRGYFRVSGIEADGIKEDGIEEDGIEVSESEINKTE